MANSLFSDRVVLVNEEDEIIGDADKKEAHLKNGLLHQAISLFIFRKQHEFWQLLLQQRSEQKIVGAGQWANSLCANVRPGESHRQCLYRRAQEELGLDVHQFSTAPKEILRYRYQVACENGYAENEIDHLFVLKLTAEEEKKLSLMLNPAEVKAIAWFNWPISSQELVFTDSYTFTPWFKIFLNDPVILRCMNVQLSLD